MTRKQRIMFYSGLGTLLLGGVAEHHQPIGCRQSVEATVDDVDVLALEPHHEVVDLIRGHHVRRQRLVELIVR